MCCQSEEYWLHLRVRGNNAEICQLAAIHGTDEFNVYIVPSRGISPSAAAVNKLSVKNGHLFYDGRPVATVQLNVAIGRFLDWLLSLKRPCLLFAHNAKLFDAKHLQRALEKSNQITRFQKFIPGFCDTLPAFKEVLPTESLIVRKIWLRISFRPHTVPTMH